MSHQHLEWGSRLSHPIKSANICAFCHNSLRQSTQCNGKAPSLSTSLEAVLGHLASEKKHITHLVRKICHRPIGSWNPNFRGEHWKYIWNHHPVIEGSVGWCQRDKSTRNNSVANNLWKNMKNTHLLSISNILDHIRMYLSFFSNDFSVCNFTRHSWKGGMINKTDDYMCTTSKLVGAKKTHHAQSCS